ncbi:MAG: Calx-beta domain-containing protein, partial [Dolichospermum sp.]
TDFETGDFFNSPAPGGPYGTDFSVFNGINPNGTWSLYVVDDAGGDVGTIAGGWSLNIGTGTATPVVTVVATDADAGEPANPGQYTLTRTGDTTSALTVNIAMNGTATNGADYTTIPTTVTFLAGSATAVVNLNVIDDTLVEGTETAILNVAAGAGYTVGAAASATVNIADNDLPAITVVATDAVAGEPTNNGQYTLTRTGDTTSALTVNIAMNGTATNGADYTTIPTTVTFLAGSATAVVNLNVIDDTLVEGNETAILNVAAGAGYTVGAAASATVNIADNDLPAITVAATDADAGEPANNGQYTLTRTGSTASALTVNIAMSGTATNGADYTTISTPVNFAAGSATALVNLNVIDDTLVEGTETAILTVLAGTGYTVGAAASATVNIADNDGGTLPVVSLASNYSGVSENGKTNLFYNFTRSGATTNSLTVNFTLGGTATRGNDYNAYGGNFVSPTTGNIVFASGQTTAQIEIVTTGDTVKEANETIA